MASKWIRNPFNRKPIGAHRYLSHSYKYDVDGEDLPTSPTTDKLFVPRLKATAALTVPLFFVFDSIVNLGASFYHGVRVAGIANAKAAAAQAAAASASSASVASATAAGSSASSISVATPKVPSLNNVPIFRSFSEGAKYAGHHWLPFQNGTWLTVLIALALAIIVAWLIAQKFNYVSRTVAHDQLGDARFLEIDEIKDRYKEIPEKDGTFAGYGGLAVSHYKNKYYINDQTVNTLVIGTSRSGKGQTSVVETIDNLSRAKHQSSLVVNDPKGELFVASKETLEKRGYDVHVLNLDDPLQSMSYNPLQLVIQAWRRGDIENATQMINTLTHALYDATDSGENKWVYEGAQSAVNGMIMALLKYCSEHDCWEKVTLYNVADMLNELGTLNYQADPNAVDDTNALDAYFESLPAGDPAKKQYGSTSFSGERAKGSILSTVNQGLAPFELTKNAKMTSANSLELKSIGFPKYVTLEFPDEDFNKLMTIQFFRDRHLVSTYKVRVGANGFTEYNFDTELQDGDIMLVRPPKADNSKEFSSFKLKFGVLRDTAGQPIMQKATGHEQEAELDKNVQLLPIKNGLALKAASLFYSDKPVAIFMLIPDSDTSNHALASIFIRQLYTELAKQTRNSPGKKCVRRVHFVLDEFGNMIKIPDMAQILTVTNGRQMLWDLFVQSFKQLNSKYGDSDSATIKENCQLLIYIFSTDQDTVEEISNRLGNYTALSETSTKSTFNFNEGVQQNAEADALITKERINGLLEGETLVMDPLHRQDNQRHKVRSYPIFNTRESVMPYAYQFLKSEFDTDGDINEIEIKSQHATLNLAANAINYLDFVVDFAGRRAYKKRAETKPNPKPVTTRPARITRPDGPGNRVNVAVKQLMRLGLAEDDAKKVLNSPFAQARVILGQGLTDKAKIDEAEAIINRMSAKVTS